MTTKFRGIKWYPGVQGIHSLANIPAGAFNVFRCTGCGGEDVSMWFKAGVQHWASDGAQRVCGTYELLRPYQETGK